MGAVDVLAGHVYAHRRRGSESASFLWWGRNLIQRAGTRRVTHETATPRSFGGFDLLLRVRDDLRQGAIRYRAHGQFQADDTTGVPAMTDLPSLLSAADDVVSDRDDEQSLALLLQCR